MKMELKMENGQAVLQDGRPVYVTEDGKDFVADVPSMYGKTLELKGEAKRNREQREAAEKQVTFYREFFPDMEPDGLKEWKAKADEALNTVKNLEDKELLDANKVDQIKNELKEAHDKNLATVKRQFSEKEQSFLDTIGKKDNQIFDLMVGNAFANSKYFAGKEPLTVLPPDIALATFGRYFRVEENKNTKELQIVGYFNGNEILSKQPDMVGEIAPVEEAIEHIIEHYPAKDRIMAAGKSGSGAGGGSGSDNSGDELSRLQKQYQEAMSRNDGRAAIALKNKIFAMQTSRGGTV